MVRRTGISVTSPVRTQYIFHCCQKLAPDLDLVWTFAGCRSFFLRPKFLLASSGLITAWRHEQGWNLSIGWRLFSDRYWYSGSVLLFYSFGLPPRDWLTTKLASVQKSLALVRSSPEFQDLSIFDFTLGKKRSQTSSWSDTSSDSLQYTQTNTVPAINLCFVPMLQETYCSTNKKQLIIGTVGTVTGQSSFYHNSVSAITVSTYFQITRLKY